MEKEKIAEKIQLKGLQYLKALKDRIMHHEHVVEIRGHGFMIGVGTVTVKISYKIKKFQSGELQQYAFVFVAGVIMLALFILYSLGYH